MACLDTKSRRDDDCLSMILPVKKGKLSKAAKTMQQLDDMSFQAFFGYILEKFKDEYSGCKRFNWPKARREKTKNFF